MENKNNETNNFVKFIESKGFYIVLILCAAAIGVSGYVLFFTEPKDSGYTLELPVVTKTETPVTAQLPDVKIEVEKPQTAKTPEPKPEPKPETKAVSKNVPVEQKAVFLPPVNGAVSQEYSKGELVFNPTMGDYRTHNGADIDCEPNTRVAAISDGKVQKVWKDELYGNCISISHANGIVSKYLGLGEKMSVKEGQKVTAGDIIGVSGTTNVTESHKGEHLHIEVQKESQYVNPFDIIKD